MTSYIKGIYEYVRPGSNTTIAPSPAASPSSPPTTPTTLPAQLPEARSSEPGYLKRAASGVASGLYTVGSGTVGAGVSGVKWVAGTTYSVGSGLVGTAGAVVAGTANTVVSGTSTVISKVTTTKKKEHTD
ncbi:hypothetical protein Pmani_005778 [Petrolisthes manimaculis]|uniref:Uncharacterized protein n=2 Tax=Petrolisthes TaxID=84661 RepID=A0AAE1QC23_9EUCA|nr:hypothetical protein Pcinc_013810 [Petrolisthes cinctipes]KAK4323546.1 hypothetical protein Pmani_005778 [Petrolisthes manimaculis]